MKMRNRMIACILILALDLCGCEGAPMTEAPNASIPTRAPAQTQTQIQAPTQAPAVDPVQPTAPASSVAEPVLDREAIYQEAVALMNQEKDMEAAGLLMQIRDYQDCAVRMEEIVWRGIQKNQRTFSYDAAVKEDGSVVNACYEEVDTSGMSGIVSISSGFGVVAGLREDGSVQVCGDLGENDRREIESWTDVIAIYTGATGVVALRADGCVLTMEADSPLRNWNGIAKLFVSYEIIMGLRADGSVVCYSPYDSEGYDVSGWSDITDVAAGMNFVLGLRSDGTVVSAGMDVEEVSQWRDIVAIDAYNTAMGLRADGSVVLAMTPLEGWGLNEYDMNVDDLPGWRNVVAIDTWGLSFIGLRADGTVLACGMDEGRQLQVDHWRNVRDVIVENYTTVALCGDGTVLKTGYGQETLFTGIQVPED
ncbi:MAG: hypothetical protein J6C98_01950 [Oscillospiraceae bacterium]|nr:hypothetical protein [Oscillospiraceae bacterium]